MDRRAISIPVGILLVAVVIWTSFSRSTAPPDPATSAPQAKTTKLKVSEVLRVEMQQRISACHVI